MSTQRQTLKLLCKSILVRMENQKLITFPPRLRQVVQDEVFSLVSPFVLTEEDLRDRTIQKMGASVEKLAETEFSESDQFKAAKAVIKKSFGDDELNGFYFQKPLKTFAHTIADYLMRSSHIEDVFETDEELEKFIIESVRKFNPAELH